MKLSREVFSIADKSEILAEVDEELKAEVSFG